MSLIEGYSVSDIYPMGNFESSRDNRIDNRNNLNNRLNNVTSERDRLQKEYEREYNYYIVDKQNLKDDKAEKKDILSTLKNQIRRLENEIANLKYDIKSLDATIDRKQYNELIPSEQKFAGKKQVTEDKLDEILPLKRKENSAANSYFNLLTSQNAELSAAISKPKNSLTTSDRKYMINDSKHPYYITLNRGLLFLYILVALYVIYQVMTGMITQNMYGKLLITLVISLYPIYIFGLEQSIYNQYLFVKAMIRAEPYVPITK
jgi:flagellar motility protein MotE (MotC chaperone)